MISTTSSARWLSLIGLFLISWLMLASGARAQTAIPAADISAAGTDSYVHAPSGSVATLGAGDVLQVNVYGQPDLSSRVTVDLAGDVTLPLIGPISVNGLSPTTLARHIEQELHNKKFVVNPRVSVDVIAVRSRVVSLMGEVVRPGRYPIENNLSLLELLAQAGGTREGAADNALIIRRSDSDNEPTRMERPIGSRHNPQLLSTIQDETLEAGDVIIVPPAPRFYVYGEVTRAGAYPIEPGLDVMRALSLAGGLTPRASDRRIYINRTDPDTGKKESFKATLEDEVLPGDVVQVNERFF